MKLFLIFFIRVYQKTFSILRALGLPLGDCRFAPTCSEYMISAISKYGVLVGVSKGVRRIARCNPFFRGGFDSP